MIVLVRKENVKANLRKWVLQFVRQLHKYKVFPLSKFSTNFEIEDSILVPFIERNPSS